MSKISCTLYYEVLLTRLKQNIVQFSIHLKSPPLNQVVPQLILTSLSQVWVQCHGPSTLRSILFGQGAQGTPVQQGSTGPSTSWCLLPSSTWLSTSPTMVSFCVGKCKEIITLRDFILYFLHVRGIFVFPLRAIRTEQLADTLKWCFLPPILHTSSVSVAQQQVSPHTGRSWPLAELEINQSGVIVEASWDPLG